VDGKLDGQGHLNAVLHGQLLHLQDDITKRRFLVDNGAAYSVYPHQSSGVPVGPPLHGPGGQPIACWGERCISVSFSGRPFDWTFLLADVKFPILGTDFLRHQGLVVDLAAGRLIQPTTLQLFASASSLAGSTGLLASVQATPEPFRSLFCEFQDVAGSSGTLPPVKHSVEHVIETAGRPVTAKFRRLDAGKLLAAKTEFLKMESEGIIQRSSSCWASPLHMVRKADGSWRPCGDYRHLNLITTPDKYPVPNIQDLSTRLHGCRVFSKLDLR
jgi:cleavage and polyadenylation specificity factor subunit 1